MFLKVILLQERLFILRIKKEKTVKVKYLNSKDLPLREKSVLHCPVASFNVTQVFVFVENTLLLWHLKCLRRPDKQNKKLRQSVLSSKTPVSPPAHMSGDWPKAAENIKPQSKKIIPWLGNSLIPIVLENFVLNK